jgi:hypothetical protein
VIKVNNEESPVHAQRKYQAACTRAEIEESKPELEEPKPETMARENELTKRTGSDWEKKKERTVPGGAFH